MLRGGDSNVKKYNIVNRRIFILSIAKGVVFTGIIAKLFSLQINENKKYLTLSDKNRLENGVFHQLEENFMIILEIL